MLPAEAIQWPTLLDMTKEECRRMLRRLELTAYSGVVSAFRGQGELSKEKRRLLAELASALGVPADRHRAEVRRAVNDESLNTIAHRLAGAGTRTDWAVEGRRVVPVLPRGRPITAYTAVADASRARADRLAGRLPVPADTRSYEPVVEELSLPDVSPSKIPAALLSPPPAASRVPCQPAAAAAPHLRPPSPTPGVIRLPSGMSIQLEDELQGRGRKRRRSSSSGDAGPKIHPPPATRSQVPTPPEAYVARLPLPTFPLATTDGGPRPRQPAGPGAPPPPPPARQQGSSGPRPAGVTASCAPPLPTAVTATAAVNTSSGHKVIFVSSTSSAPSAAPGPPRTTPSAECRPGSGSGSGSGSGATAAPGAGASTGTGSGPGAGSAAVSGPGSGQAQGQGSAAGERRPRPPAQLDPNTDTYRQLAGLDVTGSPLPAGGQGRARGRGGRRQSATFSGPQQIRSATRVASGVKIITHTVPLGTAAGTKVVTKGGAQPVLVMPSSVPPPTAGTPVNTCAPAAAGRTGLSVGSVRTGAGGRVVTVSGGPSRTLVRQQHGQHGYALPRAVHVGRSPTGGAPARPPASVIVLQKGGGGGGGGGGGAAVAGRTPTVVRPARPRQELPAVFVSPTHTPAPSSPVRLASPAPAPPPPPVQTAAPVAAPAPAPTSTPTPTPTPAPTQPAPAPAQGPTSAGAARTPLAAPTTQEQQRVNNSTVLSDILHATGIINPKSAQDVVSAPTPPPAAAQKPPPAATDAVRPPASSPGPGRPAPRSTPVRPQQQQQQQMRSDSAAAEAKPADADTVRSLTLEQAMGLLNPAENPEQARLILRHAGITVEEAGTPNNNVGLAQQAPGEEPLSADPSMELVGELDPQTGIFYPVTQNSGSVGGVLDDADLVQISK